ncbi:MAG: cyclic-di-AMP receptor [Clostridia bacterium]|nr:cyclic-di-AMP receptor [Clostridia bacterium]
MKLIIAIVNNDDSAVVSSALTKESFSVTKLSTTGGFLQVGNTTFLIGAQDSEVGRAKEIIRKYSMTRTHTALTTDSFGKGLRDGDLAKEVKVGGATVFVLSVDEAEKF